MYYYLRNTFYSVYRSDHAGFATGGGENSPHPGSHGAAGDVERDLINIRWATWHRTDGFRTTRNGNFCKISSGTNAVAPVSLPSVPWSHERRTLLRRRLFRVPVFLEVRRALLGIKRAIPWEIRFSNAALPLTYNQAASEWNFMNCSAFQVPPGEIAHVSSLPYRRRGCQLKRTKRSSAIIATRLRNANVTMIRTQWEWFLRVAKQI